jgi:hypothetical protein
MAFDAEQDGIEVGDGSGISHVIRKILRAGLPLVLNVTSGSNAPEQSSLAM